MRREIPADGGGGSAMTRLRGELLWPAWERLRGRHTDDHLGELARTEWLRAPRIERLQLQRLRLLLSHAGAHVPYWRELFARLGFDARAVEKREDLAALQPLSPGLLHARGEAMRDPTLGFTEELLDDDPWRRAVRLRCLGWAGVGPGRSVLRYGPPAVATPGTASRVEHALRGEIVAPDASGDPAALDAVARRIAWTRPAAIACAPSSGAVLARHVIERGLRAWPAVKVLSDGPPPAPADRAALERAFGPVFVIWEPPLVGPIAASCGARGLHLLDDSALVEVAGPDGWPARPGEVGELLVTDLRSFARPIVRYRVGARAAPAIGPCACGRELRRIEGVEREVAR